jgi:integrase
MRHTMATLLAAADVHPAKIADRMGHADVTMALKRYTHVSDEMQRDAADALADILAGESDVAVISA